MAYIKNLHIDELRDELGNVTQEGTAVTAAKMNHIEDGIEAVDLRVTEAEVALGEAGTALAEHTEEAAPHGATVAATPDKLMIRDIAGRAKVADPSAAGDIANKGFVEGITGLLSALSTTAKGTLVAAINELVTAIGTKLNASAYTAADVLVKVKTVDGADSGLDADSVRGVYIRNNAGSPEYSFDKVVWNPMATKLVKPSNNIKHVLRDVEIIAAVANNGTIIAKFIPNFSGSVRVTAGLSSVTAVTQLRTIGTENSAGNTAIVTAPFTLAAAYDLPLGTVIAPSVGISLASTSLINIPIAGYGTYAVDMFVTAGVPYIFVLGSSNTGTSKCNYLVIAYDEITAPQINV